MYQIVIDGPSGSGKTTIARKVSEILGVLFFDSDILKTAIAVCSLKKGVNPTDEKGIKDMIKRNKFELLLNHQNSISVSLNGETIQPEQLKNKLVAANQYNISKLKCVEEYILATETELSRMKTIIIASMNATKLFTNANFKFFLTSDSTTRARRKLDELHGRGIYNISYDQMLDEIINSDKYMFNGEASGVEINKDAKVIDTTLKTQIEVANEIVDFIRKNS
ncbi:MAG: (d)CMP kinase [Christensenellaceae bacterium]|jgi:cytidylate kinase|nr:(d)CMP kinase [Christensenellaceae bacterium]